MSLPGEPDFHGLEAAPGRMYGYDSRSGQLMVGEDKKLWDKRAAAHGRPRGQPGQPRRARRHHRTRTRRERGRRPHLRRPRRHAAAGLRVLAGAEHREAVDAALDVLQDRWLYTRTGAGSCAAVPTRGVIAAAFDHWDTRTGDPNLHTHVVLANKVQGEDGLWRSRDSRALHHAAVALSDLYDDFLTDTLAGKLPVRWGWRPRGERRTPAFELDGLDDPLLAAFSTRSDQIDEYLRDALADFMAAHGHRPNRPEMLRMRQQATKATRPAKTLKPLQDLMDRAVAVPAPVGSRRHPAAARRNPCRPQRVRRPRPAP